MHRFSILRYLTLFALIGVFSLVVAACDDDEADDADNGASSDDTEEVDDAEESDDESSDEGSDEEAAGEWHGDREIVFADYGWDSAIMLNRISQFILEEGYGYETSATPGETIPLFQGQIDGDIDISMEIWVDQNPPYAPAVEEGSVVELGNSVDDTVQGWWVPTYVIEGDEERGIEPMAPDLESIDDLPDYWELFEDPEDPGKGRLYAAIAGWEADRINEIKFRNYGLGEYYNRFQPGSGTALNTSLASAHQSGEPWLGYMWTPTWVAGQYDITLLEEPEYTDECWDAIVNEIETEEETDAACAWPVTNAVIAANADFADSAPDVVEFLEQFNTNESHISAALSYMSDNEVGPDEAAIWFLEEYEDMWTEWVPDDVAENVQSEL
ncbi:MAG: ABC transporter substrate-binding protein [Thermomicrobiaceae bacterium]